MCACYSSSSSPCQIGRIEIDATWPTPRRRARKAHTQTHKAKRTLRCTEKSLRQESARPTQSTQTNTQRQRGEREGEEREHTHTHEGGGHTQGEHDPSSPSSLLLLSIVLVSSCDSPPPSLPLSPRSPSAQGEPPRQTEADANHRGEETTRTRSYSLSSCSLCFLPPSLSVRLVVRRVGA